MCLERAKLFRFLGMGGVLVGLALPAVTGCEVADRCGVPGLAVACSCGAGAEGARVCGPDLTLRPCDCSGAIPLPKPVSALGGDMGTSGSGGTTAGQTAGVSSGGGAGGGGGTGGTGSEEDGGVEPVAGTSAAGTEAMSGMGGTGGTGGGTAGEPPVGMEPYRACSTDSDCDEDALCVVTPGFPDSSSVCAPACIDVGDCPVPEGDYEASPVCDGGYCKLDCTPVLFQPLLSCPQGMVCVDILFGVTHCHDDGM